MFMAATVPTITIGIPAYNEAGNIRPLLEDILRQSENGFRIEKIIVNSDGSSDTTVELARSIDDPRIEAIDNQDRRGQSFRQNQIMDRVDSDILVLMNADIALDGEYFLKMLVQPILDGRAAFTSSGMLAFRPKTFVEKMLAMSLEFKDRIFNYLNGGDNLYTCHGAARAFSRGYYQSFRFRGSVGEDAYSYLFGKANGHRYVYVPSAIARIKLPETLRDHFKQSVRFRKSQNSFDEVFGSAFVARQYAIPKKLLIEAAIVIGLRRPLRFAAYLLVTGYSALLATRQSVSELWEVALTSKQFRS